MPKSTIPTASPTLDRSIPISQTVRDWQAEFNAYYRTLLHFDHKQIEGKQIEGKQKKVLLVSGGRSGSHLLVTLLNSHPDIVWDFAEATFHQKRFAAIAPSAYLNGLALQQKSAVYGCTTAIGRLKRQRRGSTGLLQHLEQSGWKFIFLWRRNVLRKTLSTQIVHARQQIYDTQEQSLQTFQIHIEPTEFLKQVEKKAARIQQEQDLMSQFPHLELIYEDDLLTQARHQTTMNRVFDYLGVESEAVSSPLKKTTPHNIQNIISNYSEWENAVRQSPFAEMLDAA